MAFQDVGPELQLHAAWISPPVETQNPWVGIDCVALPC
jgi:hypothetical protein